MAINDITRAVKTADQTLTNQTTAVDDNALTITLEASKTYKVTLQVRVGSSANYKNVKFAATAPTGAVCRMAKVSDINDGIIAPLTAAYQWQQHISPRILTFVGVITTDTTAGDFTITWAQHVADGSTHTIYADSYLEVVEIG